MHGPKLSSKTTGHGPELSTVQPTISVRASASTHITSHITPPGMQMRKE